MNLNKLTATGALLVAPFFISAQPFSYDKFGKGIKIESADSASVIKVSARIQNLFIYETPVTPGGSYKVNAMTRRARLKFDGYTLKKKVEYKIELGLSNRDISSSSELNRASGAPRIIYDAVVKYRIAKNTSLWFGQTKLPGNRERVISSQKLQFVDRSLVNSEFNIDRDFGFQLRNKFSLGKMVVKPILAISTGEGRNITSSNVGGYDYTGRVEFLPFGEFTNKGDYFSSDLEREKTPKLSLGLTYDYNERAVRQSGQLGRYLIDTSGNFMESDLTTFFGDLMFKYNGFSILAEAAYRNTNHPTYVDANGNSHNTGFGYTVQAGYLLPSNYEFAGRYTRVSPIAGMASSFVNTEQYTLGVSKYIYGHDLKVQTDLTYEREGYGTFANENLIFRLQTELSF
ncbi:MAG: porin [Flavobacteriales bacterium]